jgi:hypothetical protein
MTFGTTVSGLSSLGQVVTRQPRHPLSHVHGPSLISISTRKSSWSTKSVVSYERATSSDRMPILNLILQEKMNPLGVVVPMEENFVVARGQDPTTILGAGQLKPLGDGCFELSSCGTGGPGSGNRESDCSVSARTSTSAFSDIPCDCSR